MRILDRIAIFAFFSLILLSLSFSSILWTLPLGITAQKASPLSTAPLVYDDNLFVLTSQSGYVYAVSPTSGKSLWSRPVGSYPKNPVKLSDMIIVASSNGTIVAFKRDGAVRWNSTLPNTYIYGITSANDLIYATTSKGVLTFDKAGNSAIFYNLSEVTYTPPAATANYVVFGYDDKLVGLNSQGTKLWTADVPGGLWVSAPVIDGSMVFVGSLDKSLYAFDVMDGFYRWKFETSGWIMSTPYVIDSAVYFGSNDGNLYSVKETNGELRWKVKTREAVQSTPVSISSGGTKMIYFGSNDNNLYAVNDATGEVVWKTPAKDWAGSPALSGKAIIFPSHDGRVYAVSSERACTFDSPSPDSTVGYREFVLQGKVFSEYGDAKVFFRVNGGDWSEVQNLNGTWFTYVDPKPYDFGILEIECKISDALGEETSPFTSLSVTRTSNVPLEEFTIQFPLSVEEGKEFSIVALDKSGNPVPNFNVDFQGVTYSGNGSVQVKALKGGSAQRLKITKEGFYEKSNITIDVSTSTNWVLLAMIGAIIVLGSGAAYYKFVMKK
jgi:outer membrane protein assembly factor BamB